MHRNVLMWLSVMMAVLLLTACGTWASHTYVPAGQWPSLAGWPVRVLKTDFIDWKANSNEDLWPCFSPDGSQILFSRRLFSRRLGGKFELFLVPVAGGQPLFLTPFPLTVSATRATWSMQGSLIAFTGTSSMGDRIWTIKPDGSSPRELHSRGLSDQMLYPSWFPNGEAIAAMDAKDMVIKKIDLVTGAVIPVTDRKQVFMPKVSLDGDTGKVSVSPDGKWIAFEGQENAGKFLDRSYDKRQKVSIWLVNDSGLARTLESNPGQGIEPTWSPDGQRLAFASTRGGTDGLYAIFLINRDGTGLTQITDQGLNAHYPAWSPDGRQLAFSARPSEWKDVRGIGIIDVSNHRSETLKR
jgi:Tol biopolymer transport system component